MTTVKPVPMPALDSSDWTEVESAAKHERANWYRGDDAEANWHRDGGAGLLRTQPWHAIKTGCGKEGSPHRKSYRPDLPLRSTDAKVATWADKLMSITDVPEADALVRLAALPALADHSQVSKSKAHPASYRPDLPLVRFGDAQLVRPTKEDKAAWEARPLRYSADPR